MSSKWRAKVVALRKLPRGKRRQVLVLIGLGFLIAAILEVVAPEWATVFFDLFSILVSVF